MHAAITADNATHLTHTQAECSILERLLHLSTTEWAEVAAIACRAAVGLGAGYCCKVLAALNTLPQSRQVSYGSLLSAALDLSTLRILPAGGTGAEQR